MRVPRGRGNLGGPELADLSSKALCPVVRLFEPSLGTRFDSSSFQQMGQRAEPAALGDVAQLLDLTQQVIGITHARPPEKLRGWRRPFRSIPSGFGGQIAAQSPRRRTSQARRQLTGWLTR